MGSLSEKFSNFVQRFSSLGGTRDWTAVELLKEFPTSREGVLSLEEMKFTRPELRNGIEKLLSCRGLTSLYMQFPECENHVYFNETTSSLVADDPQLIFYLSRAPLDELARMYGKRRLAKRDSVFVSYSHVDGVWLERLLIHLKPLERSGKVEMWADTRIRPGERWRDEIEGALERARIAVLLVSADFLASEFIADRELPPLLLAAEQDGATVLPVVVGSCLFSESPISSYQAVNDPGKPLDALGKAASDDIFVRLAKRISELVGNK